MEIFIIGILCVGVYFAGIFTGCYMLRSERRHHNEATSELVKASQLISGKLDQFAQTLPKSVQESLDPLLSATSTLVQKIESHGALELAPQQMATVYDKIQARQDAAHQELLTTIQKLLDDPLLKSLKQPDEPPPEKRSKKELRKSLRRRYMVDQHVAIIADDIIDSSKFFCVNCRDLSPSGVSFTCENQLRAGQEIVLALTGANGVIFIRACVRNCRQKFQSGIGHFRIGCEFIERVADEKHLWREKFKREVSHAKLDLFRPAARISD